MTRTHRRISRALVALVGVTFALGLIFWLHNLTRGRASAGADGSDTPVAAGIEAGVPLPRRASDTAIAEPTTKPSPELLIAHTNAPTTQPTPGQKVNTLPDASILATAQSKFDAGKLLDARTLLNDALLAGTLSNEHVKRAKQLLNEINKVVVFSARKFPDDPFGGTFTVPPGGALSRIARSHDVSAELLQRINGISDPRKLQAGQNIKVLTGPFHALVNKTDFTLELWLGEPQAKGSMYITSFPVGLGKDDSTPTGTWAVTHRIPNPTYYSPRGDGIVAADDPKNPLGEYWIGLTGTDGHAIGKTSYGIHGTIEPQTIGKQMSMGCIRLKNEDVAVVYDVLVQDKSTVVVKE